MITSYSISKCAHCSIVIFTDEWPAPVCETCLVAALAGASQVTSNATLSS